MMKQKDTTPTKATINLVPNRETVAFIMGELIRAYVMKFDGKVTLINPDKARIIH